MRTYLLIPGKAFQSPFGRSVRPHKQLIASRSLILKVVCLSLGQLKLLEAAEDLVLWPTILLFYYLDKAGSDAFIL